jgi:hypothetical protein
MNIRESTRILVEYEYDCDKALFLASITISLPATDEELNPLYQSANYFAGERLSRAWGNLSETRDYREGQEQVASEDSWEALQVTVQAEIQKIRNVLAMVVTQNKARKLNTPSPEIYIINL